MTIVFGVLPCPADGKKERVVSKFELRQKQPARPLAQGVMLKELTRLEGLAPHSSGLLVFPHTGGKAN